MVKTYSAGKVFLAAAIFILLQSSSALAGLCLAIDDRTGSSASLAIGFEDELCLSFKHSIYNSTVEEIFAVRERGLQLIRLRYSEARLVEFYGYEQADFEDGVWVVRPEAALLRALNLSVSDSSKMKLILRSAASLRAIRLPSGGALRISVAACD
jgi:hypothetical protein